jgi:3'-phosphoadenosine 5'-phosphosulfate sulfotransferase (PAPS reductase)/FAD synthetase
MTHLVAKLIPGVRVMSIKDDCDYPGEVEYIERLAKKWGVELDIVRPGFSLQEALRDGGAEAGDDLHSRASAFSDAGFYSLIETYRQRHGIPGVYLGLRKNESHARLMHRAKRGAVYTKRDGETVCMPLCDWSDVDVYAYLFAHDIEPLHVYRCVRLARSPADIRKSWWVPGSAARYGQVVWLRTYYPSLYARLCELMPDARSLA